MIVSKTCLKEVKMSTHASYYTIHPDEINLPLPVPTFICDECGGGSWKKIKKGSEIEQYLIFCRCDEPPPPSEPPSPPASEQSEPSEPLDKKQKELRSRMKKKHHVDKNLTTYEED